MNEIFTAIEIAASASDVWKVLTDFDAYPEWNSMMRPEGTEIRPGARLRIHVRMSAWLRFSFRPTIRSADPGRELAWKGRLPARLLQGVHSFIIEPRGNNRVRFVHREVFSGFLVPIYMWLMAAWATRAYAKMNEEIKARVEQTCPKTGECLPNLSARCTADTSS